MSSAQLSQCSPADPGVPPSRPVRPKFHHQNTSDRLRESLRRPPSFSLASNINKDRKSMFKELGLDTGASLSPEASGSRRPMSEGQKGPELAIDGPVSPQSPTPSTDSKPWFDDGCAKVPFVAGASVAHV